MSTFKGTSEPTPCRGAVNYTVNPVVSTITCRFAALTQGAVCATCPWSKLCQQLFVPVPEVKKVLVKAFSGMPIGELPITQETPKYIEVRTNKGITLKFDRKSGLQMNATNPKYANKIDPAV
jgi:hypothetical protein